MRVQLTYVFPRRTSFSFHRSYSISNPRSLSITHRIELPETVHALFRAAGWRPGRRAWFTSCFGLKRLASFPLGRAIVREFGGLHVGHNRPGESCATSDIVFYRSPTAAHREDILDLEPAGEDWFPLGEAQLGYLELFLDARGRLIVYGVPDGSISIAGESFAEGVERMLLGRKWFD